LNSRMKLLEVHNTQLEMQLGKLRQLLNAPGGSSSASSSETNSAGIISGTTPGHHGPGSNGSITSNKTGTLNTKAVTASQLATNSPILPHKMNGNNTPAPPSKNDPLSNGRHGGLHQKSGPPALPPRGVSIRSRDGSMNRDQVKPPPPAVPPKRSSLTRSDLALFSAENNRTNSLPRRDPAGNGAGSNGGQSYGLPGPANPRARDFSLTRMSSLGSGNYNGAGAGGTGAGSGGHWTDSLPRRDFYSNIAPTGSLPRRDKAGLGRPEPPRPPSAASIAGVASEAAAAAASARNQQDNGLKGNNLRRRDLSLNRDNTSSFRDAFSGNKDKRNSTGNLYFEGGNAQDPSGLSSLTNSLQQGSARILRGLSGSQPVGVRDSTSSLSSMNSDYDPNDPQAMFSRELRTAAGDLGKELKNLITLMDQEEQQQREKEQKNATLNKESPV